MGEPVGRPVTAAAGAADPFVVELLGPPGAGKSTLTPLLTERLRRDGHAVRSIHLTVYESLDGRRLSRDEMRRDRMASLLGQPRLAAHGIRCLMREGRGPALSWMINLARRNRGLRTIRARVRDVVVLEEGPLSALCLAGCASRDPFPLERITRHLALPDIAVSLTLDPVTATERVIERAGRLSDLPGETLFQSARRYLTLAGRLESVLTVPVLRLDSEAHAPGPAAATVASALGAHLPEPGSTT